MADRGILFSAPMVRALLAGRKTQTRRLLTPPPPEGLDAGFLHIDGDAHPRVTHGCVVLNARFPHAVGDRLYVREAWAPLDRCTHNDPGTDAMVNNGFYRADESTIDGEITHWTPAIHMPRRASRLWLAVTDVRVQRLQDISEADAIAEGLQHVDDLYHVDYNHPEPCPIRTYAALWNSLHTDPGTRWPDNPWIYALKFTVHQGNIDG